MPVHLDEFSGLLLDVSIKAALLACVAGAILKIFRLRDASLQHCVWTAVLMAMFASPLLVYIAPSVSVPIVGYSSPAPIEARPEPVVAPVLPIQEQAAPAIPGESATIAKPMLEPIAPEVVQPVVPVDAPQVNNTRISLPHLLFAVYLAGAAWFAVRLFIGIWRAKQLVSTALPIELPLIRRQVVGSTNVCQSSQVRVPLTVGWWRATVLLPSDWAAWDDSMLAAVLSHETEHVRRRDQWVSLLAELNRALFWFHPVAWFLRRRLSTLAEAACDDAVVATLGDRASYARHLLTVAARVKCTSWRLAPAGVSMARTPRVEQRIDAILDSDRPLARRLSVMVVLTIILVAVPLVLVAAGLRVGEATEVASAPAGTAPSVTPASAAAANKDVVDESTLISAGPIHELENEAGGHTFEFPISVPKRRKFGVSFGEWPIRTAVQTYSLRQKESDGPSTATLYMQRTSSFKAKERGDVLLSSADWLDFRLKIPGCSPEDASTLAAVPLHNVPGDERKLVLIPSDSPLAKAKTGVRLLLIVRKGQDPKTAADVEKITPRGELIVSLEPASNSGARDTLRERLARVWRQSDSGIGTFFVRYQRLVGARYWLKPPDVQAVHKIVQDAAEHNLKPNFGTSDTDAEQGRRFVEEISQSTMNSAVLNQMKYTPLRAQGEFRMVGPKRLEISETQAGEKPGSIHLSDGDVDMDYSGAEKQLNVYQAGRPGGPLIKWIEGPGDFRTLLRAENPAALDVEKMLASASVELQPDGRAVVSFQHGEVVVNPLNGFVERFTIPRGNDTFQEIYQFGPKEFPGEQTFPRVRVTCDYRGGKLWMMQILSNDELRLNEGFSDSDFVVKLPAGTNMVDFRQADYRRKVTRVKVEIPDAVAYVKARTDNSEKPDSASAPKTTEQGDVTPIHKAVVVAEGDKDASGKVVPPNVAVKPTAVAAKNQVRGRVVMRSDGKAVPNAAVVLFAFRDNGNRLDTKKAKSNAAGEFVFEKVERGAYQIVASIDDYSSRREQFKGQPVKVPAKQAITLSLDKMPSLAIQVVAKADGKPIAGAIVRPAYGGHDRDQQTDTNGKATLRTLTHQSWNIEVEAKNCAKQQQAVSLASTESAEIKFEMQPGGVLSGTIKDDAGKPLAGAGISVFPADYVGGQLAYMRTKSDGRYRFEFIPLDRALDIIASKTGFVDGHEHLALKGEAGAEQVRDIALKHRPDGGSIAGSVTDSQGKPIAGAELINEGRASRDTRRTMTDASGNFRLDDVVEGSIGHELIVKAKGYAPQRLKFAPGTASDPRKLAIVVETGHRIRGRLVNESGKAISAASVYYSDGNHGGNMGFGGNATTDAEGRFTFDSLPKDSPFNIHADGYSEIEDAKLRLDGDDEIVVTMKSEGTIQGRVVDAATGKPIDQFNVQITFSPDRKDSEPGHHLSGEGAGAPSGERFANSSGAFVLKSLIRDMPLQVTVTADGYERKVERRVVATTAGDAKVVEFRMEKIDPAKSFAIRGRIVDEKNQPIAGAQLQFISAVEIEAKSAQGRQSYDEYPIDWQMIRRGNAATATGVRQLMKTVSGADGTFAFNDVHPAPQMQIVYWGDGLSQGRLTALEKLPADERQKMVIKTVAPGIVRGTIDRKGLPDVTSIEITPSSSEADYDWHAAEVLAADTSYEIRNVPPGKYTLQVHGERVRTSSDGFEYRDLQRRSIEVKSGETLTFDIKGAKAAE